LPAVLAGVFGFGLVFAFASVAQRIVDKPAKDIQRSFKGWHVRCQTNGDCVGRTVVPDEAGLNRRAYILRVTRNMNASIWEISLTTVASLLDAREPIHLRVEPHKVATFQPGSGYRQTKAVNDFKLRNTKLQIALIRQMQNGRMLTAVFRSKRGEKIRTRFSLQGFAAARLWIDDYQTRTARAADNLPVKPQKTVVPHPLLKYHDRTSDCHPFGKFPVELPVTASQLDKDRRLYILPCRLAAYNVVYRAYLVHQRNYAEPRPLHFAEYSDTFGWTGTDVLINSSWDEKTRTLSSFRKGRGLGDCGSAATYRWLNIAFKMIQYRYWGKCDGSRAPEKWPVIYRAP